MARTPKRGTEASAQSGGAIAEQIRSNPRILEETEVQEALAAILIHHREVYNSPFPDPSQLAAYEQLVPGAAAKIIAMAESNLAFRQFIVEQSQRFGHTQAVEGQRLGFGIALVFAVLSAYLAMHGNNIGLIAQLVAAVALVVTPFLGHSLLKARRKKSAKQDD